MSRDLRALPKAHLHVHLEGGVRPATSQELCARDGTPVPEIRGYGTFTEFASTYVAACEELRTPDDLRRMVFGPGILEEYDLCRGVLGLDDDQLAGIDRASLEGSGAPADIVAAGRAEVDARAAVSP